MDNWIIFGGWALPPSLLAPIFGTSAIYIDVNTVIPLLVTNNSDKLYSDWQQRLCDIVVKESGISHTPFGIAGWSTGAMLAWAVADRLKPATGVFLSATPSFCRRRKSGYLYGKKSSVLRSMRAQLLTDPDTVVNNFCKECGILTGQSAQFILQQIQDDRGTTDQTHGRSAEQLISGLHFLEQASILPLHKASFPALFLHGKNDTIIPVDAGRYFCNEAGGTFVEFTGPHAFFLDNPTELAKAINDFIQKAL